MKDLVKNCPNQNFDLTTSATADVAPQVVAEKPELQENVIAKLHPEDGKVVRGELQAATAN